MRLDRFKMTYIMDKLYLGSINDAYNTEHLRHKLGITHILTISVQPLNLDAREGFVYQQVNVQDMDTADLLGHVESCNTFISEGRAAGGILVHCMAGKSRSSTVVIAYVMQTLSLTFDEAYKLVRCQRREISPNHGFEFQLKLYERMGSRVDVTNNEYKVYRLERLAAEQVLHRREHGVLSLPDDAMVADPSQGSNTGEIIYSCRKCRRYLFQDSSLLQHVESEGQWRSNKSYCQEVVEKTDQSTCTQSLFTEPILWMKQQILTVEGKLSCPKCQAKLGSFNWCGERCPCGEWVIPAFHISTGKVDKIKRRAQSIPSPRQIPGAAVTTQAEPPS